MAAIHKTGREGWGVVGVVVLVIEVAVVVEGVLAMLAADRDTKNESSELEKY